MKRKVWRMATAAALAAMFASDLIPMPLVSDMFGSMAITANAETTTSTINVSGTDYTLFTGFTATDGNGNDYAKLVDGNTSTDWKAFKSDNEDPSAPAGDFNGGTEDPAFVEFHADEAFIPKGYVLTCYHVNAGFWKPVSWALKAKLNESDEWTTIQSSTTTLGAGKTFEIACDNNVNNKYQYFRFEVYEVGTTDMVDLDELQFYGSLPAYTHLTAKAATCTETGVKVDCYRRNSDGKYFTDETGITELAESDVIAPVAAHTGAHHEATDTNIEYWQCSVCDKYFRDEDCTTEITEEDTKIYRTITIDNSISGLVRVGFGKTQALAGETVSLFVSDQIDASTLKVNDGAVELAYKGNTEYTFYVPAAEVTVTAEVAQSNVDGDILTGSIRHTVTIADGANITLNNATITGSIVCEGTATITLVGTNSVSGATNKAGIQIGGSDTTLTIRGDGSLTANGGAQSAGIGLSRAWDPDGDVIGGDIVIEGGNITANGGSKWGAGIGTGVIFGNGSAKTARIGNITIKGGTVKATGGTSADGIGTGYTYSPCTNAIGTVTIYDGIDKVDASSIKDFASVVYKHDETNVTASKADYFAIGEDGNRRLIVQKPVIADIDDQTYTGSEITPEPLVLAGSLSLTKGTDYEYSYTNNTNVGTAKVNVTFKGDYESLGSVEKEFKIVKATPTVTAPKANTLTYNGNKQELITAGSTDFGTVLYSLDGETYSADIPTATDAGTYTVYYKVEGSDNWNATDAQTAGITITASYTVTWKNGTETLETDNYVPVGTVPTYDGAEPTKEADTTYSYSFAGWTPNVSEVTGDTEYTAIFTSTPKTYNVTYKVDGKVYGEVETVAYGTTLTAREVPTKTGYTFSGWSEIPATMPDEDVTITGTFNVNSHTVTYKVDGEVYGEVETVAYGTTLTAREVPTKTGYTFSGWSEIPATMPDEDVIITGTFNVNSYVITLPEKIELCEGYSITDGKVSYGSELKFKAADGYIASNVKVGNTVLEADENGVYSIAAITNDTVVTAEILLLGDADLNGKLEKADAALVLKHISSGTPLFEDAEKNTQALKAANINGKDGVDMLDVIAILNKTSEN